MNVAQETLGLRRGSFSLPLSLLMSAFALPISPADLTIRLRRLTERSPTARAIPLVHSTKVVAMCQACLAGWRQTFIEGEGAAHATTRDDAPTRLWENGLKWIARTRSFGVQFEPRYIFRAGRLDQ